MLNQKIVGFLRGTYKPRWNEIPLLTLLLIVAYVGCGVLVNKFAHLVPVYLVHIPFSDDPAATFPIIPGTLLVGLIFVLRDYTQQVIRDRVIACTLAASAIVCVLIDGRLGLFSGAAFLVAEGIDQFLWHKLDMNDIKDRILKSSAVATLFDGAIILYGLHELTVPNYISHYIGKMASNVVIWLVLRHLHNKRMTQRVPA
jgi:hypothetical protein